MSSRRDKPEEPQENPENGSEQPNQSSPPKVPEDLSALILDELSSLNQKLQVDSEQRKQIEQRIYQLEQYAVSLQNLLKNPEFLKDIGLMALQQVQPNLGQPNPPTNSQSTPAPADAQSNLQTWAAMFLKGMEITKSGGAPASQGDMSLNTILNAFKMVVELQKVAVMSVKEITKSMYPLAPRRRRPVGHKQAYPDVFYDEELEEELPGSTEPIK
mgnify:CR=1 FL=1